MSRVVVGKRSWGDIYSSYHYRAEKKGFTWEITKEQFNAILKQPCHYCGDAPTELNDSNVVTVRGVRYFYSGLDRIDNAPIYSLDTVVPCCAKCNQMKSSHKREEFLNHVKKIAAHTRRKART